MKKNIRIIGVPIDLGQSRRGVDMGPSALRYGGLAAKLSDLGYKIEDAGNINVSVREIYERPNKESFVEAVGNICQQAYELGRQAVEDGFIPIFLGGDHSIAIGTIGGITHDSPAGVIWIDAHGDFNIPETSPNGNIHGMPVAVLLGYGLKELVNIGRKGAKLKSTEIVLIGTRNLDFDERTLLKNSGIKIYTMSEIDKRGLNAVANEAIEKLSHLSRIHVSLDVDVLDPHIAPGVGTPASGGLTYREAHLLMELLAETKRVASMDVVEINPILDSYNKTGKMGVELVTSLFGQRIL